MAFNPVYQNEINVRRSGVGIVRVTLLKEGFGGSVSEMRLAAPPVEPQGSKSGSDELTPLRPKKGALRLHASEQAVIDDVYADDKPWRIRIERAGVTDVVGPIRKHLRTTSDDRFSSEPLDLKYNDGLGPLEEVKFTNNDGQLYTSQRSVIAWIAEILRKTGLGLDIASASEWYTPGMDAGNPLEQEFIPPGRLDRKSVV